MPGGGPTLDAFVIYTDVPAVEILQGVKTKIRLPSAPAAVNDGLAARVQSCRAHTFLDTVSRDQIVGIVVSQNPGRVANVDGTGDMYTGVGIGRAYGPHKHVARDSSSDILVSDDDRRSSQCSVAMNPKLVANTTNFASA